MVATKRPGSGYQKPLERKVRSLERQVTDAAAENARLKYFIHCAIREMELRGQFDGPAIGILRGAVDG